MHKRVIVSGIAALLTALLAGPAMAAAPKTVVLEGLLTSSGGGVAADGVYDMTFNVYETKTGGSAVWSESAKVGAKGGQFHHALGSVKALDAGKLAALKSQWIGLKVGTDPEMPRQPLHSAIFALYANWAGKLSCSGCLNASHIASGSIKGSSVGFAYAGSKTKGGAATSAEDLKCTGCVSVSEIKWDGNVDLGTRSLKAASVAANSFIGDGSKLTGIKHVTGECKTAGEVIKGINPDGSLKCVKALDPNSLPKDGLDEISNGQLSTQFQDVIKGGTNKDVPDNNPQGLLDSITFPDIGIAQDIKVHVDISNSDTGDVIVYLFPPKTPNLPSNRAGLIDSNHKIKDPKTYPHYTLHYKKQFDAKNKTIIKTTFPKPTKELTGDIHKDHLNTNIKGEWRIWIIDSAFLNNKNDGKLNAWSIEIKTLSNKTVNVSGTAFVGKKLWGMYNGSGKKPGDVVIGGSMKVTDPYTWVGGRKIWYGMFPDGSRPFLIGRHNDWLSGRWSVMPFYQYAHHISTDSQTLLRITPEIIWGDRAGNITWQMGGPNYGNENNNRTSIYLTNFVKNTTSSNLKHTVCFHWSSSDHHSNQTSIALNKGNVWNYASNNLSSSCPSMTYPANKSSTVVLKTGFYRWTDWNGEYGRTRLAYYSNTWLPQKSGGRFPTGMEWDYQRYFDVLANK